MRLGRLFFVIVALWVIAVAGALVSYAVNQLTPGAAGWLRVVGRYPLPSVGVATGAACMAGLLGWAVQRWYDRAAGELVPALPRLESWEVERPDEVRRIVRALKRRHGKTAGITIAVQGAGGFGKTTIAKMACCDRRVLRRFSSRVHWVPLGRDVGRNALPGRVAGLIGQIDQGRAVPFTNVRQAADHLAAILAKGPRRLLVLDDVWSEEQLAAFPAAGRCARLVTTRVPSLAAGGTAVSVTVDQMTGPQARSVITHGLPPLPPEVITGLLEQAGRWPLLLHLVNKFLASQDRRHADDAVPAKDLLDRLRGRGPLSMDEVTGAASRELDVGDPGQRNQAVRATIEASTSLLGTADRDRLAELAVFAADEAIPITLVTTLWHATGGLDRLEAGALVTRLADLALFTLVLGGDGGAVTMHEVIRDYLRGELGDGRVTQLHQILLDTAGAGLPRVPAANGTSTLAAWWELPAQAPYLHDHLIGHLLAAGQANEAEDVATDLRWAQARLEQAGPAGPYADLTLIGTPRAERLRRLMGQVAHLLAPTDPPHSLVGILRSRISHDPDWGQQLRNLSPDPQLPELINKWPLPDLPDTSLRATLIGHKRMVWSVAIAPDGTWLATGSDDETARTWDAATGLQRAILAGHKGPVRAVAIAPDGTWLATGSADRTVRTWDAATGLQRARLRFFGTAHEVAISPDGGWLAGVSWAGTVRAWDPATGRRRALTDDMIQTIEMKAASASTAVSPDRTWLARGSLNGAVQIREAAGGQSETVLDEQVLDVSRVLFAADGTWLATGGRHGTVRIRDAATGHLRAHLTGHQGTVLGIAASPDGTWLATGSGADEAVRTWDPATGLQRAVLIGHTAAVTAVAVAPDGAWLASGSGDRTVRTWDASTGRQRAVITGHKWFVLAVAIAPDGTWLATAGDRDGSVRIWDAATSRPRAILTGHTRQVRTVAIAPDGTWLATSGKDGTARIWDAATGRQRAVLTGHPDTVMAVAISADGTWLATASLDGALRIWDPATGEISAIMRVDGKLNDCTWSPDGRSLAAGGDAGLYLFTLRP